MNTALDVFNKVSEHLLAQNHRALSVADLSCVYRSPTGLKCAVGCLIEDQFYSRGLEGLDVRHGVIENVLKLSGVPVTETVLRLLQELQQLHDYVTPAGWPDRLEQIKDNFFGVKHD